MGKAWAGLRKLGAAGASGCALGNECGSARCDGEGARDPEQDGVQGWEMLSVHQWKAEERTHLQQRQHQGQG